MIYLGLDLGSKTLGLSISDKSGLIATPLEVVKYNNYEELLNMLEKIVLEKKVDVFVLGNPINLSGKESIRSKISLEFKDILIQRFNKEVIMQDERFSTIEAERILIDSNISRKKRKEVVDKMASCIILQSYLDRRNNGT